MGHIGLKKQVLAMDDRARSLLDVFDGGAQIAPLSDAGAIDLPQGYDIASQIHQNRVARGEQPVGRKIGFTNRTIWPIYNVTAPVWGWIYDSTLHDIPGDGQIELPALPELRLEPEIAFGLQYAPEAGMGLDDLLGCIEWAAHSVELVFSAYPAWGFTAPDTAAAFGMHGALWLGQKLPGADVFGLDGKGLNDFTLTLEGMGERHTGHSSDVLGSPLHAVLHLIETLADQDAAPLSAGEVITTGTLTDARPIAAGQSWRTQIQGCVLPGLSVHFA